MEVKLANGDFNRSTHTATRDTPSLPIAAREAHIFPIHFQLSLLSVGQLCDNDCEVNLLAQSVTVRLNGDIILVRQCNHETGLWRFNLTTSQPEVNPTPHAVCNVYEKRSFDAKDTSLILTTDKTGKSLDYSTIASGEALLLIPNHKPHLTISLRTWSWTIDKTGKKFWNVALFPNPPSPCLSGSYFDFDYLDGSTMVSEDALLEYKYNI
jgi:hypothetical protein